MIYSKALFLLISVISIIMLVNLITQMRKASSTFNKKIILPVIFGIGSYVSYVVSIITTTTLIVSIASSIYFICIDWLIYTTLLFFIAYTGSSSTFNHRTANVLAVFIFFNTVSFIINIWTNHVFSTVLTSSVVIIQRNPAYFWVHVFLCYCIVVYSEVLLMKAAIKEPYNYKHKYTVIMAAYFVVLAINYIFYKMGQHNSTRYIDYSVALYLLFAVYISYCTVYLLPHRIAVNTLRTVTDSIEDAILFYNNKGNLCYCNNVAKRLFDTHSPYSKKKLNKYYADYKSNNFEKLNTKIQMNLAGQDKYFDVSYKDIIINNKISGKAFHILDKTADEKKIKEELYKATHDELTGILNREGFMKTVDDRIKTSDVSGWYMISSNIRDFKLINSLFGRQTGDKVLKLQAKLASEKIHEGAILGRIADDKFALFMRKEFFKEEYFTNELPKLSELTKSEIYKFNISLGIYDATNSKDSAQIMYDKSQLAIARLKNDYQHVFSYYTSDLMDTLHEEKMILANFDHALKTGQFVLYLQSQVKEDGSLCGTEALVRWIHPQRGMINPELFISVLEKNGCIYELDKFIWEQAAIKLKEWKEKGITDLSISVNVSAKDFYYIDVYEEFIGLVKKYDISPQNLRIELTETVLMSNLNAAKELFTKLQAKGFLIEIDDFGSGYSSLNVLKDISANVLKIDRAFIKESENYEKSFTILNYIISMAEQLGMQVICEGVESKEQIKKIENLGCSVFQGYYFSKPLNCIDFEAKYLR